MKYIIQRNKFQLLVKESKYSIMYRWVVDGGTLFDTFKSAELALHRSQYDALTCVKIVEVEADV